MSTIDKLRAKQGRPAPAPATPDPGPTKPGPATVKHRCGHERSLADFTSQDCPGCRDKARQEKIAKQREKTAAKAAQKQAARDQTARLPAGAEYRKAYDAAAQQWRVHLAIPGTPGFEAVGSGSMRTEFVVDGMYRDWLKEQAGRAG